MRRAALLASVPLLLAVPAFAQPAEPLPVAAAAPAATPAAAFPVLVRTGQHAAHGRVVLHLRPLPPHALRKVAGGWELRLRGTHVLDLATTRPLAEVSGLEVRQEGGETVLLLRSGDDSRAEVASGGGMLWVDIRRGADAPAEPASASAASASAAPARAPRQAAETPARAEAPRRAPPGQRAAPAAEDAAMRDTITSQIGRLNAGPAAPTASAAPGAAAPREREAPAAPPLPACVQPFSMSGWQPGPGAARERLNELRGAFARSEDGIAEAADLAEFYVAHLLAHEALALAEARPPEAVPSPAEGRLVRAADVARLLLRRPVPVGSPLLAEIPGCEREDLPLWRGLAAAATGDGVAVAAQVARARASLREVPDRLRYAFALILADAVGDDAAALRTLLAPLRLTPEANAMEVAGRAWLQARIARLDGNREEEMQHLTRAAQAGRTLPGLYARLRIAGLQAARSGPEAARAETQLFDFLRTYRFDALGEEAAITLGNLLLARGDYAGALATGESAGSATGRAGVESRGAQLIARILRRLLTEEAGGPAAEERLALWWRYEGYATPGERGDDIRLGAARLMLAKGFPEAALDTLRGLTPATAATPTAAALLAQAEATASQGDPQRALALIRSLPPSRPTQRAAAAALARLNRPAEAVRALDGLIELPDRVARAGHLYTARDWPAATAAYADLLRDPALDAAARPEASARYASARALAGSRAGTAVPESLLVTDASSQQLLQLGGAPAPQADPGIASVRAALERARGIEQLLPTPGNR